jgi:hypothetical protein
MMPPLWKTVWRFLKKLKRELLCDSVILLPGTFSENFKAGSQRVICITMFTVAKYPLTDENYNTLVKQIEDTKNGKISHVHGLEGSILLKCLQSSNT